MQTQHFSLLLRAANRLSQVVAPVDPYIFQLSEALEVDGSVHVIVESLGHTDAHVHSALLPLGEARAQEAPVPALVLGDQEETADLVG